MKTPLMLDVKRMSVWDGPGVRTTFFVKGCPLRCVWCHNPESIDPKPQLARFRHLCRSCPTGCTRDELTCPGGALKAYGKPMSMDEIVAKALEDRPFYDETGGGVTLSGGEPLYYWEWAAELFKRFKAEGLHTCLDTSLYAPPAAIEALLPVTDLWLPDYKAHDDALHQRFTGGSNEIVRENLKRLVAAGADLEVRCLPVPGKTDGADLQARHRYLESLGIPEARIVDLTYHDHARAKYEALAAGELGEPLVRIGLVADVHHADRDDAPWNDVTMYRESLGRLKSAMDDFRARRPDLVIELGDFKDIARKAAPKPGEDPRDKEATIRLTKEVESVFARFEGPRYHVLGNHDNDMLDKDEFLALCPNTGIPKGRSYYSFVIKGVTVIVLDGNFTLKGEPYRGSKVNWVWTESLIPPEEISWLKEELAKAKGPVVVAVHQRLDAAAREHHRIANGEEVQKILSDSGKVVAVFQGHDHLGGCSREGGVLYYTLRAMVAGPSRDCNSYAEAAIYPSGAVVVSGFGRAESVRKTSKEV